MSRTRAGCATPHQPDAWAKRPFRVKLPRVLLRTVVCACSLLAPSESAAASAQRSKSPESAALVPAGEKATVKHVWTDSFVLSRTDGQEIFKRPSGEDFFVDYRSQAGIDTLFGGSILEVKSIAVGESVAVEVRSFDYVSVEYRATETDPAPLGKICFLVTSADVRLPNQADFEEFFALGEDSQGGLPICIQPEVVGSSVVAHLPRDLGALVKLYAVRRPKMEHFHEGASGAIPSAGHEGSAELASASRRCVPSQSIISVELINLDTLTRTQLSLLNECRAESKVFGALMTGPPRH